MSARRLVSLALVIAAVGCGHEAAATTPASGTSGTNVQGPQSSGAERSAVSNVRPSNRAPAGDASGGQRFPGLVETCGARESYDYVARVFQCPGGGNPLGGTLEAGARARLGSLEPHVDRARLEPGDLTQLHIVDLYEVPCPTGPVQVHVCMYHCADAHSPGDG